MIHLPALTCTVRETMVPARLWATHLQAIECTSGEYWCSANGEKTSVPLSSTCIKSLTPLTVIPSSTVCQRTIGRGVPSAAHSTRAPVAFEKKTDTGGSTTNRGPCSSPPYPRAEIRKKNATVSIVAISDVDRLFAVESSILSVYQLEILFMIPSQTIYMVKILI